MDRRQRIHGAAPAGRVTLMRTGPRHPPPVSAAMRISLVTTAVLVSTLLVPVAPARAGDAARELVVQLSAGALESPGASARSVGALPTTVRRRFAALGLQATRTFAEQLAASREPLPEVYDFHPERIVLVEAPDTALAASALAALQTDLLVDWAE